MVLLYPSGSLRLIQITFIPTNPPTTVDITTTVVSRGPITVCLCFAPTSDGDVPDLLHYDNGKRREAWMGPFPLPVSWPVHEWLGWTPGVHPD